jgi:hypothetical protein
VTAGIGGDRYITAKDIQASLRVRETHILDTLGILWRDSRPHIRCPLPDHTDAALRRPKPIWRDLRRIDAGRLHSGAEHDARRARGPTRQAVPQPAHALVRPCQEARPRARRVRDTSSSTSLPCLNR